MAREGVNIKETRYVSTKLWTDLELRVAVEAYLYLSRLERGGLQYSKSDLTAFLLSGPLRHRNDASIRYRMRNISFVFHMRGLPTLKAYSPAAQVGAGVRARIEEILDAHSTTDLSFLEASTQLDVSAVSAEHMNQAAAEQLERLETALNDLEGEFAGIGHNHPPEPIEENILTAGEIRAAASDARQLRHDLSKKPLDAPATQGPRDRLLSFGLKLATWIGGRLTKFTDAALVSLASVAVAKATNLLPLIVDTVRTLAAIFAH